MEARSSPEIRDLSRCYNTVQKSSENNLVLWCSGYHISFTNCKLIPRRSQGRYFNTPLSHARFLIRMQFDPCEHHIFFCLRGVR
jgi:hypothetical protein